MATSSKHQLSDFCFNSEGRGRMSFVGQKFNFGHEALLDKKEKKLLVHLKLPQGSMDINTYWDASRKRVSVKTNVETRLENHKDRKLVGEFKLWWGMLFKHVLGIQGSQIFEEVQRSESYTQLWKTQYGRGKVQLLNRDSDQKFKRLVAQYTAHQDKRRLTLELIVRKCFTKP